jgi:hypothetical protein
MVIGHMGILMGSVRLRSLRLAQPVKSSTIIAMLKLNPSSNSRFKSLSRPPAKPVAGNDPHQEVSLNISISLLTLSSQNF